MRIYISIPITGTDPSKARERADLVKAALSRQGHRAVSPFDVDPGCDPEYADYICCDLRAMLSCDGVYFCKGWEESLGCNIEHDTAMRFKSFTGRNPHARDFRIFFESEP